MRKTLSPSGAREFEWCPALQGRYLAGETHPEAPVDVDFEIRCRNGTAWHTLIQRWLKAGTFTMDGLISQWRPTFERHLGGWGRHDLGKKMLRMGYPLLTNYHKRMVAVGLTRPPMLVEKQLKMPLLHGWHVTGRLDAVWQHGEPIEQNGGGLVELVDWKTGRGVKSEKTLRADWQLLTYVLLLMKRYGVERVLATIHYVARDKRVSTMLTRRDVEAKVKVRYVGIAEMYERKLFPQVNDERCSLCPFALTGRPCKGAPQ